MEAWEFLLQREEDTTWLPLESSDVEILEGRYRIVARSGHPDTEMEVRITHHAYEETPPIRRVQTRSTTTNPEGLMVVIPYTRLKPGIWDLSCSPGLKSDSLGISEQKSIKLRVFSQETELGESPQFNSPTDVTDATSASSDLDSDRVHLVKSLSELPPELDSSTETTPIQQPYTEDGESPHSDIPTDVSFDHTGDRVNLVKSLSEIPPEVDSSTETTAIEQPETKEEDWVKLDKLSESEAVEVQSVSLESVETTETTQLPPLQLTLNQTAYIAKLGEGLLVSGQVQLPEGTEAPVSTIPDPHLQVSLRDPQTTEILTEIQQAVPSTQLPMLFSAIIYLPFECKTRLILAEVILYSQTVPLVSQTFTITTQVEHLLQAIEEDFTETDELEAMAEDLPNNPAFYLSLPLELDSEQPQPQLNPTPTPAPQSTTANLELPAFGHFLVDATAATSVPSDVPPQTLSTPSETSDSSPQIEVPPAQPPAEIKPLSPVEQEFKHLNIQSRFWARLNALATDQDLSQWMKKSTPKALPETPLLPTSTSSSPPIDDSTMASDSTLDILSPSISEDLESQEIVIDDEPLQGYRSIFPRRRSTPALPKVAAIEPKETFPDALLDSEPIPAPTLQVGSDEIVAGRSVPVRVRLPQDLPRVYVKIWVYDRQARHIIDGPRWLTEFAPNGLEQIETMVNLDIAYGSLEIQIEAIAVEMQTQRESQKVTVERSVIPPAEPSLPLEED